MMGINLCVEQMGDPHHRQLQTQCGSHNGEQRLLEGNVSQTVQCNSFSSKWLDSLWGTTLPHTKQSIIICFDGGEWYCNTVLQSNFFRLISLFDRDKMGVACIAVLSPSVRNIVFLLQGSKPDRNTINSVFSVLQNVPLYLRAFGSDEEVVLNAQLTTHAALDVLDERGKHHTLHGINTHCFHAFPPFQKLVRGFHTAQRTSLQLCNI
jgi:hypothetical protein